MTDTFNAYKEADARDLPGSSNQDLNRSMESLILDDEPSTSQAVIPSTPVVPPPPVVRPVVKQFELKKLVGGFCTFFLYSVLFYSLHILDMDQFGLSIKKGTVSLPGAPGDQLGIFIQSNNRGSHTNTVIRHDQLLKIDWKKSSATSPLQTVDLTVDIDNLQVVARKLSKIPTNVMCTVHIRRLVVTST